MDRLKLEGQLCFPLYAVSKEIIKRYRPYLEALNLTYTQYIALLVLWEKRRLSVKELGQELFLDSGTLTPMLKNLETKGYVSRYRSTEDERVLIVEVTQAGDALKETARGIPDRVADGMDLTAEETEQLHALLCKLLGGL